MNLEEDRDVILNEWDYALVCMRKAEFKDLKNEYRTRNNEFRSKDFCNSNSWKQTERSDSTLHHSKFLVRYSIFSFLSSLNKTHIK
jgi:hypothetical protein